MPQFVAVDHSLCTGCKGCEVVCSLHHFSECNPERAAIRVMRKEGEGLVFCLPLVCQQCEQTHCIEACPTEALTREKEPGNIIVDKENCTGCGDCVDACPAGCIFMDVKENVAVCCDLCGGRPLCVDLCHSNCLSLASGAADSERIENLARIIKQEDLQGLVAERGGR